MEFDGILNRLFLFPQLTKKKAFRLFFVPYPPKCFAVCFSILQIYSPDLYILLMIFNNFEGIQRHFAYIFARK
jgi:hypothetical protein